MITMKIISLDLWRIWGVIFISILQTYLIFTAIKEYLHMKSISFDPLYGNDWNQGPMGFKLSCLLFSITLLPLIIVTSVIVTGNLANDGHILGQDIDNNHFMIDNDSKGQIVMLDLYKAKKSQLNIFCNSRHFMKQQFIPISILLQILSGFCFLMPLPFIEAQQIEHKALGLNLLWHTDLDFLIDPDKDHEELSKGEHLQQPMRPAFFNLIFCLSLLSFRYPSVFWRTNRKFSLLFYLIIIILSLHVLIDYSATSLLIRLSTPGSISIDLMPSMHPITIAALSFVGSTILIMVQMTVFNYGIMQYFSSLANHRQNLRLQYKNHDNKRPADDDENCSNVSTESADSMSDSFNKNRCPSIFNQFGAHITAIFFGCLAMGMKVPLFLHQWKLYSRTGDRVMCLNIIVAVIFSVTWLVTWFGFTLNNRWTFKVSFRSKGEVSIKKHRKCSFDGITCSTLPTTSNNALNATTLFDKAGSPVYATCNPAVSSAVNRFVISPNHRRNSSMIFEEGDLSACNNYVLLHNSKNPTSGVHIQHPNIPTYASIIRQANKAREKSSTNFPNIDGNMTNADESFGSEKSSESNFSRSLTGQDRNRYSIGSQEINEGTLNQFLVNRYYTIENSNYKLTPFLRSPLLSYNFSTESSPSEHSRREFLAPSLTKVTFSNHFTGPEPDLIIHKYPVVNRNEVDPSLNFLRTDDVAKYTHLKEFIASNPSSNNQTVSIHEDDQFDKSPTNITVKGVIDSQKVVDQDFLMNLNGLEDSNDEEERLCSQV